jgi:hypothetical protein
MKSERLQNIYVNLKQRCYNPKSTFYKNYGGRSITVCDEWLDSEMYDGRSTKGWIAFKNWALSNGYADDLTIDRIDNSKGYCPENCHWVTMRTQQNNRRSNHLITYKGKTQSLANWCRELNLNYDTIKCRIRRNWTIEKAFETKSVIYGA